MSPFAMRAAMYKYTVLGSLTGGACNRVCPAANIAMVP